MIIYESYNKEDIQKLFSEVYKEFTTFSKDLGFCKNAIVKPEVGWLRTNATRALGKCVKVSGSEGHPVYEIRLNPAFLEFDVSKEQEIKETIAHELCHTLPGCFNHGKEFHEKGKLVQTLMGYPINTLADEETSEYFTKTLLDEPTYKVICDNCGNEENFVKLNNYIKKSWQYKCPKCGKPYLVSYKLDKKTGKYTEVENRDMIDAYREMMHVPPLQK